MVGIPRGISLCKRDLRKIIKKSLLAFPEEDKVRESRGLTDALLRTDLWRGSSKICLYSTIPGLEVKTNFLIDRIRETGRRVYLPRIIGPRDMVMVKDLDIHPNDTTVIDPRDRWGDLERDFPDLVIVPGLGFCPRTGERLGYGGGFYDTWVSELRKKVSERRFTTLALCLTPQILDEIPTEPHDISVDQIIAINSGRPSTPQL